MLEGEIARWVTFNSDDFKSQCCRCHPSLTSIKSCISCSQLKIIKNKVKNPKRKFSRIRAKEFTKNNQTLLCQRMATMELNEKKSSGIKSKFRSVSVDDLEYVVKQLIEEALEDDEKTIQLQMVVCREDYFSKYTKVKSENDLEQIFKILNNKEEKSEETNLERIVSKINNHNEEIQLNKEPEKNLEKMASFMNLNKDSTVLKEPEIKENEETKNIKKCHISEGVNESKDLKLSAKKNLRSKLTKNQETNDKKREILQETIQSKGDFTFEAWKQAKTRIYKQLLKEEKRKRQRELIENAKKMERERTAHFVYLNWKREQQKEQKLKRMNAKTANETAMALKIKSDEKRYANLLAFKEWKKRKDAKLKREKIIAYSQQYYPQNSPKPPGRTETCKPKINLDFDTWLDQLDNVLHQKYLRERRFQVRSFYCQPTYYGTGALIQ